MTENQLKSLEESIKKKYGETWRITEHKEYYRPNILLISVLLIILTVSCMVTGYYSLHIFLILSAAFCGYQAKKNANKYFHIQKVYFFEEVILINDNGILQEVAHKDILELKIEEQMIAGDRTINCEVKLSDGCLALPLHNRTFWAFMLRARLFKDGWNGFFQGSLSGLDVLKTANIPCQLCQSETSEDFAEITGGVCESCFSSVRTSVKRVLSEGEAYFPAEYKFYLDEIRTVEELDGFDPYNNPGKWEDIFEEDYYLYRKSKKHLCQNLISISSSHLRAIEQILRKLNQISEGNFEIYRNFRESRISMIMPASYRTEPFEDYLAVKSFKVVMKYLAALAETVRNGYLLCELCEKHRKQLIADLDSSLELSQKIYTECIECFLEWKEDEFKEELDRVQHLIGTESTNSFQLNVSALKFGLN